MTIGAVVKDYLIRSNGNPFRLILVKKKKKMKKRTEEIIGILK